MVFSLPTYFGSLPSPVVYFACFLLVLTFLGAFALRLTGLDDGPEFYEEVGPDGVSRVAFQFPPHESREERRRRWARALRRRFWPGLAKITEESKVDSKTEEQVQVFVQALLLASTKASKSSLQKSATKPQNQWQSFDPEFDVLVYREPEPQRDVNSISPAEAKKLRKKVFSVVMNAGPPKSLPPITEELLVADVERGDAATFQQEIAAQAPFWSLFSQMKSQGVKESPSSWVEFDSEPIMTVGPVKATRSVLWAALRKLEEIEGPMKL